MNAPNEMPAGQALEQGFRLEQLRIEPATGTVSGPGGREQLDPKVMAVLVLMAQHAGQVVARDQILSKLWPGTVVTDDALTRCFYELRRQLSRAGGDDRYRTLIETLPKRGYRLNVTVKPLAVPADAPPKPQPHGRWQATGIALVIVALVAVIAALVLTRNPEREEPKSIAVLPFADMSPEQDQQYFSDGLAEEILNLLAQSPELRVIARTSSFSFRGEDIDIATVAEKLRVSHVLEGSVRKAGNQVRITAQLVDARTSLHLWSQTYDRELQDVFGVQSDIAASVANALRVALGNKVASQAPASAEAYERVLRANYFFQRRAEGDLERARMYYQQAIDLDPNFARAWAGLAGVYWIQTTDTALPRDVGLEKLREAAERALTLDPDLPEAHLRMMNYLWTLGRVKEAREHLHRAAALDPNDPLLLGFMAGGAADEGRWDEAIALGRRAVAANPLSPIYRQNFAYDLFLAGRFEEAKTESLKAQELDPSRPPEVFAHVLILERQFDPARRLVEAWPEGGERAQCLALIYHGLGRKAEADAALEKTIAYFANSDPDRVAEVFAYRGETDEAFKWLEATKRLPPERQESVMRFSPFLKSLHSDARWKEWSAPVRE